MTKTPKGIQWLTDSAGNPTAVQIDLKRYGHLWEDIYDNILVDQRQNRPTKDFEQVRERLLRRNRAK